MPGSAGTTTGPRTPTARRSNLSAGQYAIGGGFAGRFDRHRRQADLGGEASVQITVSAPYFKGEYEPVDEAGTSAADQWVVPLGFNHSDSQVDVRAWLSAPTSADLPAPPKRPRRPAPRGAGCLR